MDPKSERDKGKSGEKKKSWLETFVPKGVQFGPCILIGDLILFSRSKQKFSEHRALGSPNKKLSCHIGENP